MPPGGVEAPTLVRFVAEILDGFVVEQAVDRLGVGLAVPFVHAPAVFQPPFGDGKGEGDVGGDGDEGHRRVGDPVERPEDAADHGDLDQGRQHVEQHEGEQEFDPLGSALDGPAQAAGAALDVEAEREPVEVVEDPEGDGADGALGDLGEDRVAQLTEGDREHPERAVGEQDGHRNDDRRRRVVGQDVHRLLVEDRDVDVRHLGADKEEYGQHHAAAHLQGAARPEIGQQRADRPQVRASGRPVLARLPIKSGHGAAVRRLSGGSA